MGLFKSPLIFSAPFIAPECSKHFLEVGGNKAQLCFIYVDIEIETSVIGIVIALGKKCKGIGPLVT